MVLFEWPRGPFACCRYHVVRVRSNAELKSRLAVRAERAGSRAAALGLPIHEGQAVVRDAQVEYVDAAGGIGAAT